MLWCQDKIQATILWTFLGRDERNFELCIWNENVYIRKIERDVIVPARDILVP